MPLTPDEIKGQKFPVNLRGYEKEEVDAFLLRVAADYQAAISAIATAAEPYGALGREVGAVLMAARESAEEIRKDADAESDRVRREAADQVAQVMREAKEEAAERLEDAADRAARLIADAERRARDVRDAAEQKSQELLGNLTRRREALHAHEIELEARLDAIDQAVGRLRAQMRSRAHGGTPAESSVWAEEMSPATSHVLADRLRSIDPDLDQVARALADADAREAEDAVRSLRIEEPRRSADAPAPE